MAGFIEQYGSGTTRVVDWLKGAGSPEPEYAEEMGGFSVYFKRTELRDSMWQKKGLNDRQMKVIQYMRLKGKMTNQKYQEITSVSKSTASRELAALVKLNVIKQCGMTGKGTFYMLIKGS